MSFFHKTVIVSLSILFYSSVVWSDDFSQKADQSTEAQNSLHKNVASSSSNEKARLANQLEAQAIEHIDNERLREGLLLMKQAQEKDPNPMRSMNYGSILFANGVSDFNSGNKLQAIQTLREAEDQLSQAIAGFDPQKNAAFIAQAYFLLGEMYLNGFSNADMAKDFYYKSLEYDDNPGARAAIEALRQGH